jgi:hypothetical protein
MICSGLITVVLRLAILGAFGGEVEVALRVAKTPGISAPATTESEAMTAFDRKPEELSLREILERLERRSREIRSLQVRFKLAHTSRQWDERVEQGEGRLVLDKGKFGVMERVGRWKPGAAAPPREISLWTPKSYSAIDTSSYIGFIYPREGDDPGWMPSDLKLPFFFDTDVAEMQKSYRFELVKSTQKAYILRVTPLKARSGGIWVTAWLRLDRQTLLPTDLWLDQGQDGVDGYRALEIKINDPIPDDILAIVDGTSWQGWMFEFVSPKHWIRGWLQPDRVDRAEQERPVHSE